MRVLYRDAWRFGTFLVGVSPNADSAVVRHESIEPATLSYHTIDLRNGTVRERWSADRAHIDGARRHSGFGGMSGAFDEDAAKFAGLLRSVGPWHSRPPLPAPRFAVSEAEDVALTGGTRPDGLDSDALFWWKRGGPLVRADGGVLASHSPVQSRDGAVYAFLGCNASPCDYGLFVASSSTRRATRIGSIHRARSVMWHPSRRLLWALGERAPGEMCAYQVEVSEAGAPGFSKAVVCERGLEDVAMTQDAAGRTLALSGTRGAAGVQRAIVRWVLTESGELLGTSEIDRAIGSSVLSEGGLLALPMQRGALGVVDLVSGRVVVLPESEGWFFGFEGARWSGDTLVLMRKREAIEGYELVAVNVRELTQGPDLGPWR